MPSWISAIGIGCIGAVYGYSMFFALQRYLPPISQTPAAPKELVLLLAAVGVGGAIGVSITSLDGVNYIGPYGIGLMLGVVINVVLTFHFQHRYYEWTEDQE